MKTLRILPALFLAILIVLLATACPQSEQPQPTPQPTPTDKPADTTDPAVPDQPDKPAIPDGAIALGPLETVIFNFFAALADGDFDKAKSHCTEEYWESEWAEVEIIFAMIPEEEKASWNDDFSLDEEDQAELASGTSKIDGDTATYTITDEAESTIFHFAKIDGNWKMSGVETVEL